MTQHSSSLERARAIAALSADDSSARLRAALHIGTYPHEAYIDELIARSGVEPDFFVRDMLTWALTRHASEVVVPKLVEELLAPGAQRRSQSLHTLSKIGDHAAWPAITSELLRDEDDEVARSAWRAAVVLVPQEQQHELAAELVGQLGRGDRDVHLSLSRAIIALGPSVEDLLAQAMQHPDEQTRAHAIATEKLRRDPDSEFVIAIEQADRTLNLGTDQR